MSSAETIAKSRVNPQINSALSTAFEQYETWISTSVLPKWVVNGFTSKGAVIERFQADGAPDLECNKRIRVQARQMFSLAYAYKQQWFGDAPEKIQQIEQFLSESSPESLSGFYPHALDANDKVVHPQRDLYDCAFFLLAYGWRYHAMHDLKALQNANTLLGEIERSLKGTSSGWYEDDNQQADTQIRRQNPHMHLFEAFLTLYDFTRDAKWLGYAGEMFSLFETVFYDYQHGVIREFFDFKWQTHPEQGHLVEPGHALEWVWLLLQYHRFTQKPVLGYCRTLYSNAMKTGIAHNSAGQPLLVDQVSVWGQIVKGTKRCWPLTEWVKAALGMAAIGDTGHDYEAHAANALEALVSYYRNPEVPEQYIDQLGEENDIIDARAPASTLYHLLMAHAEAQRFCR